MSFAGLSVLGLVGWGLFLVQTVVTIFIFVRRRVHLKWIRDEVDNAHNQIYSTHITRSITALKALKRMPGCKVIADFIDEVVHDLHTGNPNALEVVDDNSEHMGWLQQLGVKGEIAAKKSRRSSLTLLEGGPKSFLDRKGIQNFDDLRESQGEGPLNFEVSTFYEKVYQFQEKKLSNGGSLSSKGPAEWQPPSREGKIFHWSTNPSGTSVDCTSLEDPMIPEIELPGIEWEWTSDWHVDYSNKEDPDGFEYRHIGSSSLSKVKLLRSEREAPIAYENRTERLTDGYRRRVWVRSRSKLSYIHQVIKTKMIYPTEMGPNTFINGKMTIDPTDKGGAYMEMSSVEDWDFDVFTFGKHLGNRPLYFAATYFFERFGLINHYNISRRQLFSYFQAVESGYISSVPYHNNFHGADVTQTSARILLIPEVAIKFSKRDIFGVLFASIIHDFRHPGNNNAFEINTHSELALRYSDDAVLEHMHLEQAFRLARNPQFNFLHSLDKETANDIRRLVIQLVLATDLSKHFELVGTFKNVFATCWEKDMGHAHVSHHSNARHPLAHRSTIKKKSEELPLTDKRTWAHRLSAAAALGGSGSTSSRYSAGDTQKPIQRSLTSGQVVPISTDFSKINASRVHRLSHGHTFNDAGHVVIDAVRQIKDCIPGASDRQDPRKRTRSLQHDTSDASLRLSSGKVQVKRKQTLNSPTIDIGVPELQDNDDADEYQKDEKVVKVTESIRPIENFREWDDESRLLFMKMVIKVSDISHAAKTRRMHLEWTERLMNEFHRQGDKERQLGLPVTDLMNREVNNLPEQQIGFITIIVEPLYQPFCRCIGESKIMDNLHENLAYWKDLKYPKAPIEF